MSYILLVKHRNVEELEWRKTIMRYGSKRWARCSFIIRIYGINQLAHFVDIPDNSFGGIVEISDGAYASASEHIITNQQNRLFRTVTGFQRMVDKDIILNRVLEQGVLQVFLIFIGPGEREEESTRRKLSSKDEPEDSPVIVHRQYILMLQLLKHFQTAEVAILHDHEEGGKFFRHLLQTNEVIFIMKATVHSLEAGRRLLERFIEEKIPFTRFPVLLVEDPVKII